jgi:hypothetical protein
LLNIDILAINKLRNFCFTFSKITPLGSDINVALKNRSLTLKITCHATSITRRITLLTEMKTSAQNKTTFIISMNYLCTIYLIHCMNASKIMVTVTLIFKVKVKVVFKIHVHIILILNVKFDLEGYYEKHP